MGKIYYKVHSEAAFSMAGQHLRNFSWQAMRGRLNIMPMRTGSTGEAPAHRTLHRTMGILWKTYCLFAAPEPRHGESMRGSMVLLPELLRKKTVEVYKEVT